MNYYERQIVQLFVAPRRRERLEFLLGSPKRRDSAIHEFHSSAIFAPESLVAIPPNQQFADPIYQLMVELGASKNCYALSADVDLNGAEWPLSDALERVVGSCIDTVLVSAPGTVGYFEGGHAKDRYILRPARHAV